MQNVEKVKYLNLDSLHIGIYIDSLSRQESQTMALQWGHIFRLSRNINDVL